MGLAYNVSDALEEGTFEELLDPNVTGWPVEEVQKLAELALKCCELRRRDRPDLESVVLPELIRLHALVMSSEYSSSIDQGHQRSASDKVKLNSYPFLPQMKLAYSQVNESRHLQ